MILKFLSPAGITTKSFSNIKNSDKKADAPSTPLAVQRVVSVDVYRGFVMLLMMAEVLAFRRISEALPGNKFWEFLYFHQSHVEWVGCSLHDLIQPSFTFLVGVVLPFSIASRLVKGASFGNTFRHAIIRSLILIFLGIFLRSMGASQTYFTFEDTLTQIGLGYSFLFLLGFYSQRIQLISLVCILAGYWLAFALYPLPGTDFNFTAAGVIQAWEHNLNGFAAHWNKNTNLAWAFDRWFLNLFPREKPFLNNGGGYSTLSFIPTLATMILGLLAGNILKFNNYPHEKVKRFAGIGIALLALALLLHWLGICPIVKRIWTPSWVLFSGGWCFLILALFYLIVDIGQYRKWAFPLIIIGINSIAAYVIAETLPAFIASSFYIHAGSNFDQIFGSTYAPLVKGGAILLVEWLILYWMYKRKVFIKI